MVLCIPGQGSPEWATAIAAVGVTILFAAGWENREQEPTTSAQYQTSPACELPFLHPEDAGMGTTGEQIRGAQKDK